MAPENFNWQKIFGFETAKVATIYTIALGIIFLSVPQYVLLIITNDWKIIEIAKSSLRIAGFAQIFYATGVVLANGLQAGGRTLFVMVAEMGTNLFLFVPLAYLLGVVLGFGLTGAWFALPGYIIIYSLVIFLKFNSKNWFTKIPINLD